MVQEKAFCGCPSGLCAGVGAAGPMQEIFVAGVQTVLKQPSC